MVIYRLLVGCRVYHFHDVSLVEHQSSDPEGRLWPELQPEAGNLASVLYRLKHRAPSVAYQRIVRTIRLIAPFFEDFHLEPIGPENRDIDFKWRDKESGRLFGPHQLSDGTMRAICLITLLLQPENELPPLIIVDEPELGLHPYALNLIASLFKKASHHAQVLISTQSSSFLDQFEPEDIIVVDREGKESVFRRPDPAALEAWLEEYSLGRGLGEERRRRGASSMVRLYLFAECKTEETFADTLLKPHFAHHGVYLHGIVQIGHARKRGRIHRGGGRNYEPMRNDIRRFLAQEKGRDVFSTTMIDLYAIPARFPRRDEAESLRHDPFRRSRIPRASLRRRHQ